MSSIERGIDVNVPVRTAYNQWTQFESFPEFMEGVRGITQVDHTRLHWKVEDGGETVEFDTRIVERTPDRRIAWQSLDGKSHAGVVTLQYLDPNRTRVLLKLSYEPQRVAEKLADVFGELQAHVKEDLESFKQFIETRERESATS